MGNSRLRDVHVVMILVALFLVSLLTFVVNRGNERNLIIAGDIFYVFYPALAGIVGIITVRKYGHKTQLAKTLIFMTIMVWLDAIAGMIWAGYEIGFGIVNPFPSPADAVWFLFYVAGIIGLSLAVKRVWNLLRWKQVLVVVLGWVALLIMTYVYSLKQILADPSYSVLLKLLSIQYPVGDLCLLLLAAIVFTTLRRGVFGMSWLAFIIGYFVYGIADLVYTFYLYTGAYHTGQLTDLLWYVAQLLFVYGFYEQAKILKG